MIKMVTALPPGFHTNTEKPGFDVKLASKIRIKVKERFSVPCVLVMARDRKPFRI